MRFQQEKFLHVIHLNQKLSKIQNDLEKRYLTYVISFNSFTPSVSFYSTAICYSCTTKC